MGLAQRSGSDLVAKGAEVWLYTTRALLSLSSREEQHPSRGEERESGGEENAGRRGRTEWEGELKLELVCVLTESLLTCEASLDRGDSLQHGIDTSFLAPKSVSYFLLF